MKYAKQLILATTVLIIWLAVSACGNRPVYEPAILEPTPYESAIDSPSQYLPRFQPTYVWLDIDGQQEKISAYFDNDNRQLFYSLEGLAHMLNKHNISFFNYEDYAHDFTITHCSGGVIYARNWDFSPYVDFEMISSGHNNTLYIFTDTPYISDAGRLALVDFLYSHYPHIFTKVNWAGGTGVGEYFGEGIGYAYAFDFWPIYVGDDVPWVTIRFGVIGSGSLHIIYAFYNGEYFRTNLGPGVLWNLFRDSNDMLVYFSHSYDDYKHIVYVDGEMHLVPVSIAHPLRPSRMLPELADEVADVLSFLSEGVNCDY